MDPHPSPSAAASCLPVEACAGERSSRKCWNRECAPGCAPQSSAASLCTQRSVYTSWSRSSGSIWRLPEPPASCLPQPNERSPAHTQSFTQTSEADLSLSEPLLRQQPHERQTLNFCSKLVLRWMFFFFLIFVTFSNESAALFHRPSQTICSILFWHAANVRWKSADNVRRIIGSANTV